jgi:hypothetical protein
MPDARTWVTEDAQRSEVEAVAAAALVMASALLQADPAVC